MALEFKSLSMMELRSSPGEVLDRVSQNREAFIVERNGQQKACLVPLSVFLPEIQQSRMARELEQIDHHHQAYTASISEDREFDLSFQGEGSDGSITLTVRLPHGYPNSCPKVYAKPLNQPCPHRWQDGALCIFGAMETWNPGKHDVLQVLSLARRWLKSHEQWVRTGRWPAMAVGK
jgi:ubiquitin-protein ligase